VPGSGKSSLIHAIAGELLLDIYVISLSASWISDSMLTTLMGRVPNRCILLLEDLDAAFTKSLSRESKKDKDGDKDGKEKSSGTAATAAAPTTVRRSRRRRLGATTSGDGSGDGQMGETNTLSLSGLLNALDGVAAAEGRILFATTNHLEK
jgi:mitochondrial chaperone BCS1